jgi:hypothetical protein
VSSDDLLPPCSFASEDAWEHWAAGLPDEEGDMVDGNVTTRESRRGGWDALQTVNGLTFEGHGGTEAEAVADLQAQIDWFTQSLQDGAE